MGIVSREALLQALEYASPGLASKDNVEQTGSFVFKDGYIYTYNDEVACRTASPMDVEGAIKATTMLGILHKLREKDLNVSADSTEIQFKGKGKTLGLTLEKEVSLPIESLEYPKKKEWKKIPKKFEDAIRFVQGCAGRDDSQFSLTCIHLHPQFVESFDNFQMARFKIKLPIKEEILVKQQALKHIENASMVEFAKTDNWIHFRDKKKQVLSCRIYLDEYLDLQPIIDKSKGKKITLPKGLVEASQQAEIFSIDNPQDNLIQITLKPSWVIIQGDGQFGWYKGKRKLNYKGPEFKFMIHPRILQELVKEHSECELSKVALRAKSGKALYITSLTIASDKKRKKK